MLKHRTLGVLILVLAGLALTGCDEVLSSLSGNINWKLSQNGSIASETTELVITFNADVSGKNLNPTTDFKITGPLTVSGAWVKGATVWTIPVTVTETGRASVEVITLGTGIMPGPKTTTVYKALIPTDYDVNANGASNSENSTRIYFIFDRAVSGLTANDITLTPLSGSANKGTLTGAGTNWTLNITVVQQGTITVKINKSGITSMQKNVPVYKKQ